MSIYYKPSGSTNELLERIADELQFGANEFRIRKDTPSYVWCDFDAERFGPATDPQSGVHVILSGRLALSRKEWEIAKSLPYTGGLAARVILSRYIEGGVEAVVPFNGSSVLIIEDRRANTIHLLTDQFGYHPCFIYKEDDALNRVVTTFPDIILCDPDADHEYDVISMADFMSGWRATPPHTYYSAIKHVGAARHIIIDRVSGSYTSTEYWDPLEHEFYDSVDEAASALADAIEISIRERTDFSERPVYMVSGGADSRVLLFATENRSKAMGINLYERMANETKVAEDLCRTAKVGFQSIQRDKDFYPMHLPLITRWSGAMWSAEDAHYAGFAREIDKFDPDLVMTACTTDWIFKGYGFEKQNRRFMGKNIPFNKFINIRQEGFLPNHPATSPSHLSANIQERRDSWFSDCPDILSDPRDFQRVEDRRVRPTCYTVSVSGQIMARTFPYDTFLADSRIADCYAKIKPEWKLNNLVWGKAATKVCADAGNIVDANYGWSLDAGLAEKAIKFTSGWVGRRLKERINVGRSQPSEGYDRAPSSGSWPDYGWYAQNSPSLATLWNEASPIDRDRLRHIIGDDPWSCTLASWRADGHRLMRMSTLLAHWVECDARIARSKNASK